MASLTDTFACRQQWADMSDEQEHDSMCTKKQRDEFCNQVNLAEDSNLRSIESTQQFTECHQHGWENKRTGAAKVTLPAEATDSLEVAGFQQEQVPMGMWVPLAMFPPMFPGAFVPPTWGFDGWPVDGIQQMSSSVPVAAPIAASPMQMSMMLAAGSTVVLPEWENKTTVMLRNLPNKYTQKMLLEELDNSGFVGSYDFLYLPIDPETNANKGYAFVNMTDPSYAWALRNTYEGKRMPHFNSEKEVSVVPAALQGLKANRAHYSKARVSRGDPTLRPFFARELDARPVPSRRQQRNGRGGASLIDSAVTRQRQEGKCLSHEECTDAEVSAAVAAVAAARKAMQIPRSTAMTEPTIPRKTSKTVSKDWESSSQASASTAVSEKAIASSTSDADSSTGHVVPPLRKFCQYCGNKVKQEFRFCECCGMKLVSSQEESIDESGN